MVQVLNKKIIINNLFKSFIQKLVILILSLHLVSCNFLSHQTHNCVFVVDSSLIKHSAGFYNLDVFLTKKKGYFDSSGPDNLTVLLNTTGIDKAKDSEVLYYYTFQLTPDKIVREIVNLDNVDKIFVILKRDEKTVSHKKFQIDFKDLKIISLEILGELIKVTMR